VTMTIGIFVSFELGAFELANRLITIAPEHCSPFEHSMTKGRSAELWTWWSLLGNNERAELPGNGESR
jgi:hypothetical protein